MTFLPERGSLDARPVPGWYSDAKLGIFVHWGLYSVPAFAARTDGDFSYFDFRRQFEAGAEEVDFADWARCFAGAGARYVVMVARHLDGYPLWPTKVLNGPGDLPWTPAAGGLQVAPPRRPPGRHAQVLTIAIA